MLGLRDPPDHRKAKQKEKKKKRKQKLAKHE